jgi:hypothetical protein
MGLVEKKTIFSALVFISGGVGVLLPWARGRRAPAERLMGWGNAFAGGVLGGAGLVHLLSGGADEFRALAPGLNYPLAFVLACGGFLLTLLIEAVIVPGSPDRGKSMLDICSGSSGHETGPQEMTIKPHPVVYALLLVLSIHLRAVRSHCFAAKGEHSRSVLRMPEYPLEPAIQKAWAIT